MAETLTYDNLFAGNVMPVVTEKVTILKSGALSRGTVIGLITASGKGAIVLSTATDGTKDPYGVLTEDIDATAADVETTVYVTGEFNEDALTFGGEDTKATHKVGMRQIGLFLKPINK